MKFCLALIASIIFLSAERSNALPPPECAAGLQLAEKVVPFDQSVLENLEEYSVEEVQEARARLAFSEFIEFLESTDKMALAHSEVKSLLESQKKYDKDITPEQYEAYLKWYNSGGAGGGRRDLKDQIAVATRHAHFVQAMALSQIYYESYGASSGSELQYVETSVWELLGKVTFSNEGGYLAAYRTVTNPEFKTIVQKSAKKKWRSDPTWKVLFL